MSWQKEKYRRLQKNCNEFPRRQKKKFFANSVVSKRQQFIRLFCPRCSTHCVTFKDYEKHLKSAKHERAMEERILRIEKELTLKRGEQQKAQLQADEAEKALGLSSSVLKCCEICDVKFYQEESKHVASRLHGALAKLMKPVCEICSYMSKSAVDYERHLCSLEHVKNEEMVHFHTEGSSSGSHEERSPKPVIKPIACEGASVIEKVEVYKCKACKQYLPHEGDQDAIRESHEKSDQHLRNYVYYIERRMEEK